MPSVAFVISEFATAGYDIRLYPIRQDGKDGEGSCTNAK